MTLHLGGDGSISGCTSLSEPVFSSGIIVSGNVGINTSAPTTVLDVSSTGLANNSSENIINLQDGGVSSAGISLQRYQNSQNYGIGFYTANGAVPTEKVRITNTGNVGIGTTTPQDRLEVSGNIRFSAAGNGINFSAYGSGATVQNNLLDDYEQGTWTPTFIATTTNPTLTYSQQDGHYTKVGNAVHFTARVTVSGVTARGAGAMSIGGLPFNNIGSSQRGAGGIGFSDGWINDPNGAPTDFLMAPTQNQIRLRTRVTAASRLGRSVSYETPGLDPGCQLMIGGTYFTSA